jgi:putative addiction module CopG family antidote
MTIALKPEQEAFIQTQLSTGRHTDATAVIAEALRLLEKRNHSDGGVKTFAPKLTSPPPNSIEAKVSMAKLRSLNSGQNCKKPVKDNFLPQHIKI